MLSLSNDVFNALSKYLSGDWGIEKFRDYMVGLRVDKYRLLADADRMFLNEFEGRYAEFSDFSGDESLLRASLASYVQADAVGVALGAASFWSFQSDKSSGSFSINVGSPSPTGTFLAAPAGVGHLVS